MGKEKKGESEPLTIVISGIRNVAGEVRVALYNSQQQFNQNDSTKPEELQGEVFRSKVIRVTAGNRAPLAVTFDDVPPGTYAIGAFHDANGNSKLDTNSFGLPTESYGFSRNARGVFGPPKYKDATIEFGPDNSSFRFNIE